MSEDNNPIVTFSRLNKAFITKEAVMAKTHDEAEAKSKDPVEAATRLAALGNALKFLEAADVQAKSKVLVSPDNEVASLLQTFLAQKSVENNKVGPLNPGNMLGVVRTMTLAQSQFARKRSVREQLEKSDQKVWIDLVHHKWLDPLMALIAAYDVIRHGSRDEARSLLKIVNSNLKKYFEGMGDVEAIAKLLGSRGHCQRRRPCSLTV